MKNNTLKAMLLIWAAALVISCADKQPAQRWSVEKANQWYAEREWPVGCDYVPAYAGNQLQMWGSATWDPQAIDSELALAEGLGFNSVRIFLHHELWLKERDAFFAHVEEFLSIADRHGISSLVTLFTNGGSEQRHLGEDISPILGVHNSIWAQSPGTSIVNDPSAWGPIEEYEKDVLRHFAHDSRIICWCIYNEPENVEACNTLPLLRKVFEWAREVDPDQPLTATLTIDPFNRPQRHYVRFPMITFICENSDIISFHCYDTPDKMIDFHKLTSTFGRPVFCTEYLARQYGSTFESYLPYFKEHKVAAYSFGLVNGASQCHYEWNRVDSTGVKIPHEEEPSVWFHDIFKPDHSPYDSLEVEFIKGTIARATAHQ